MHRNDHPTAPGGHHNDGDPSRGIAPTVVPAATMEALQEELCHFIESRGIVLNKADNTQLKQAILDAIGKAVAQGDFVTHSEFKLHTEGGDPHQQYALESMLGDAATKDVGTAAHQVAAGNHSHAQYELKVNLKQAAYRDVGMGADQVARGDHTHFELAYNNFPSAFAKECPYTPLSWNTWQIILHMPFPSYLRAATAVRVTLPIFRAEENGRGAHPGCELWVGINGISVLASRIHNPADRYGNGLSFGVIPVATVVLPAGQSGVTITVHPSLIASMKDPSISAGVITVELIDLVSSGSPLNLAPLVSVPATAPVEAGKQVAIEAIASDPNGDPLTYQWSVPASINATGQDSSTLVVTGPNVTSETGYDLTLTVLGGGLSASAATHLTVKPTSEDSTAADPDAANWPAWEAATTYNSGDKVSHNLLVWQAKHWTQGDEPSLTAAQWLLVSKVVLAWDAAVAYNGGDVTAHNGRQWRAQYWTQGDEPGQHDVWLDVGAASSQ